MTKERIRNLFLAVLFLVLLGVLAGILPEGRMVKAQTSQYPATFDSDSSLFVVADNVISKLSQAVSISDNVVFVQSGTGFARNQVITICDTSTTVVTGVSKCTAWEHMLVTAAAGQALTVSRGFGGTSARSHVSGLAVSVFIDALHQQALKSAIMATQSWSMPAANIKAFGAVCDGTSDGSAAVTAALNAGAKVIYIPSGCGFTAPGGIVQGGFSAPIKYIGENWLTSFIQPAASGNSPLQAQPGVILENVSLRHTPNPATGIDCPIGEYYNLASSIDPVVTTTCYSGWHAYLKDDIYPTIGVSGTNIRNHGIGDGIFVGQYDVGGVGIRSDLESGSGSAILVDINGGTGVGYNLTENVRADAVTPWGYYSPYRQTGNIISLTQRTSTFSGNGLLMNFADINGTFNGNFVAFAVGGTTKFSVNAAGQAVSNLGGGYPPFVTNSTVPVNNFTGQVRAYKGGTQQTNSFMQFGTCTLSGGTCAATLSPAYASGSSYQCTGTDQTAAAAVKVANTSGSSVTFTGTGTDIVAFTCVGN